MILSFSLSFCDFKSRMMDCLPWLGTLLYCQCSATLLAFCCFFCLSERGDQACSEVQRHPQQPVQRPLPLGIPVCQQAGHECLWLLWHAVHLPGVLPACGAVWGGAEAVLLWQLRDQVPLQPPQGHPLLMVRFATGQLWYDWAARLQQQVPAVLQPELPVPVSGQPAGEDACGVGFG